jgi:hypothetical protein
LLGQQNLHQLQKCLSPASSSCLQPANRLHRNPRNQNSLLHHWLNIYYRWRPESHFACADWW